MEKDNARSWFCREANASASVGDLQKKGGDASTSHSLIEVSALLLVAEGTHDLVDDAAHCGMWYLKVVGGL